VDKGTYAILIHVPYEFALKVGQLGTINFKPGYYAYVGSALGGLGARVGRHLRDSKKVHWHIDHLLLHARAVDVVVARGEKRKECAVAAELAKHLPSITGFGSSDCVCHSHLFYSPDLSQLIRQVVQAFRNCDLKPTKI